MSSAGFPRNQTLRQNFLAGSFGECFGDQSLQWGASEGGSKEHRIGERETLDYDAVLMDLSQCCSEFQSQKASLFSHLEAKGLGLYISMLTIHWVWGEGVTLGSVVPFSLCKIITSTRV